MSFHPKTQPIKAQKGRKQGRKKAKKRWSTIMILKPL